jgi:hypothetical protein
MLLLQITIRRKRVLCFQQQTASLPSALHAVVIVFRDIAPGDDRGRATSWQCPAGASSERINAERNVSQ